MFAVVITSVRAGLPSFQRVVRASSSRALSVLADHCDVHMVQSPYPPIRQPPYRPLAEFITEDWVKPNTDHIRNKIAIVDGSTGQTRSFQDYHKNMTTIASFLKQELHVQTDTTLALFAPNHVDYVPISLAAALCGCKLTPVNPQYKPMELVTILTKSSSQILFVHEQVLPVAIEAVAILDKQYPLHKLRWLITIPHQDKVHIDDEKEKTADVHKVLPSSSVTILSLEHVKKYPHTLNRSIVTTSTFHSTTSSPFLLPYSSGTTGLPKAVCLSHQNLIANLLQLDEIESMPFPSDHRLISPLPFFHLYGFAVSALYASWRGQELITMSQRFDLELFCQLVEKYKPQRAHLVPPIILALAKHPIVDQYDLSSLTMIVSAAAPLSKDIEEAVHRRIGAEVKQGWGMSELSPLGTFTSDYNIKSGSVGPLVSNTIGKVIDPKTGQSLAPHQPGELVIKGPQVMMGYLDEPEKTAECLSVKGWLRTGDVAYYDEDGYFFITDRIKEMIKVRGYQVAPAELEALLLTHPSIRDAAVIPVQDDECGELPRAYVVLKKDSPPTEKDIKEWVKERVAPMKRLEGGVIFIDEIPKSASGKILRRLLVEKAKNDKRL